MKQRDPTVEYWSGRIDSLKMQYAEAKQRTSAYHDQMNTAFNELQPLQEEYRRLKEEADEEYRMASYCWDSGDRASAHDHKMNGQNLNERKRDVGYSLDSAHARFNPAREAFQRAKEERDRIKGELDSAYESLNGRIEELKAENLRASLEWHEKSCQRCGTTIRYNINWSHIPNYCKECKEKMVAEREAKKAAREAEEAKWKEKPCKRCGTAIRYRIDWSNIPNYCKDCKQRFEEERKAKEQSKVRKNWLIQDDNENATVYVSSNYLERNPKFGKSGDIERTDILVKDKRDGRHKHYSIGTDNDWNITDYHGWK